MNIIFIVGKTSSGKDTVANYLKDTYHIPIVCSATTREKRDYETNGKEHYFISKEEMASLKKRNDVIAYTKFKNGIEYCGSLKEITANGYDTCIYIINPDGIEWFKKHKRMDTNIASVFVDLEEEEIVKRAKKRGDKEEVLKSRLTSERKEFDDFYAAGEYDFCIQNDKDLSTLFLKADNIINSLEEHGWNVKQPVYLEHYLKPGELFLYNEGLVGATYITEEIVAGKNLQGKVKLVNQNETFTQQIQNMLKETYRDYKNGGVDSKDYPIRDISYQDVIITEDFVKSLC